MMSISPRAILDALAPKLLGVTSLAAHFALAIFGMAAITLLAIRYSDPLEDLTEFLSDYKWRNALSNTLWMFGLSMAIQIFFLFWASLSISRIRPTVKLLLVIPFITGIAAPALSLYLFCSPILGPFLSSSLAGTEWGARLMISLIDSWQWTGILLVIAFTRIERIPPAIFEGCTLEGIGRFSQWYNVILPELSPLVTLYLLFRFLDWLKKIDVINYLFASGGPAYSVETISMYAARLYFGGQSSYAATLAILQVATLMVLIFALLFLFRRHTIYDQVATDE